MRPGMAIAATKASWGKTVIVKIPSTPIDAPIKIKPVSPVGELIGDGQDFNIAKSSKLQILKKTG